MVWKETRPGREFWIVRKSDGSKHDGPFYVVEQADAVLRRLDKKEGRRTQEQRWSGPYQVIDQAFLTNPAPGPYWEDTVREGAEQALWVTSYADYVREMLDSGMSKRELEEEGYAVAGPGDNWSEVVPAPKGAQYGVSQAGEALLEEYRRKNDADIDDLLARAAVADGIRPLHPTTGEESEIEDDYAESFGHYLAMMALGHGVSWFDDHAEFPLKVPQMECNYDGDGLHCESEVRRMNPRGRR